MKLYVFTGSLENRMMITSHRAAYFDSNVTPYRICEYDASFFDINMRTFPAIVEIEYMWGLMEP
jgi:hypothetical protein